MLTKSQANAALQTFSEDVGIAKLELDKSNTALIAFEDTHELVFHFLPERSGFQLWAPFHHVTLNGKAQSDLALLQYSLQKNFPSTQLGGSYFALDASVGVVLLGRFVSLDVTAPGDFTKATMEFAQQVVHISAGLVDDIRLAQDALSGLDTPEDEMTIMRV